MTPSYIAQLLTAAERCKKVKICASECTPGCHVVCQSPVVEGVGAVHYTEGPSQTEVGNLAVALSIKQNVAGFLIATRSGH